MAFELSELSRLVRGDRSLTATCTRALSGLSARVDALPTRELARGALTANLLESGRDRPWPVALTRQNDPQDAGYVPRTPLHRNVNHRDWTAIGLPDHDACGLVDPAGWLTPVPHGPSVAVWVGDARRMWTLGPLPGWGIDEDLSLRQTRLDGGPFVRTLAERAGVRVRLDCFPTVVDGVLVFGLSAQVELLAQAPRPVRLAFAVRPANPEGAAPIFDLERRDDGWWTVDGRPFVHVPRAGHDIRVSSWTQGGVYGMVGGRLRGRTSRVPVDANTSVRCSAGQATGVEVYRVNLSPRETFKRTVWCAPSDRVAKVLKRASATQLFSGARADWQGIVRSGARLELPAYGRLIEHARATLLAHLGARSLTGCRDWNEVARGLMALNRLGHGRRVAAVLREVGRPSAPWIRAVADHVSLTGDLALLRDLWPSVLKGTKSLGEQVGDVAALCDAARLAQLLEVREARSLARRAGERVEALRGTDHIAAVWPFGLLAPGEVSPPEVTTVAGLGVFDASRGGISASRTCERAQLRLAAGKRAVRTLDHLSDQARPTGAWPEAFHPARGGVAGSGDSVLAAADVALLVLGAILQEDGDRLHVFRGTDRRWWDGETVLEGVPTRFGPVDITAGPGRMSVRGRWRTRPGVVWHKPEGVEGRLVVGESEVSGRGAELRLG
ncbi:MAG: hypothetical protein GY913_31135 [Proteobacteria bacterium]|nr:hypothetical protein [Pseudomonadota bacterium]MCP4921373.1 hypothetical protein [Pseudomonadota bacterium]